MISIDAVKPQWTSMIGSRRDTLGRRSTTTFGLVERTWCEVKVKAHDFHAEDLESNRGREIRRGS